MKIEIAELLEKYVPDGFRLEETGECGRLLYRKGNADVSLEFNENDELHAITFYDNKTALVHRDSLDGPAEIYFLDGNPWMVSYVEKSEFHRVGGPAFQMFSGGQVVEEKFFQKGYLHRPWQDGPAIVEYSFLSGHIKKAEYYNLGKLHRPRSDGPARQAWDSDGSIKLNVYFEDGKRLRKPIQF